MKASEIKVGDWVFWKDWNSDIPGHRKMSKILSISGKWIELEGGGWFTFQEWDRVVRLSPLEEAVWLAKSE